MCPARGNATFVISALTTYESWRSEHELGDAGAMCQGHAAMQGDELGSHATMRGDEIRGDV